MVGLQAGKESLIIMAEDQSQSTRNYQTNIITTDKTQYVDTYWVWSISLKFV